MVGNPALGMPRKEEDTKSEVLLGCIVSCWVIQYDSDSTSKKGRGEKRSGGEGKEEGKGGGREGKGKEGEGRKGKELRKTPKDRKASLLMG